LGRFCISGHFTQKKISDMSFKFTVINWLSYCLFVGVSWQLVYLLAIVLAWQSLFKPWQFVLVLAMHFCGALNDVRHPRLTSFLVHESGHLSVGLLV
jgi:hypothetical protein